jgi:hypothetical protein
MSNKNFFSDPGYVSIILSSILLNDINNTQTSIELVDASNFPSKGKIQIEDEIIIFDGINELNKNILENCNRTNPVSHTSDTLVNLLSRTPEAPINNYQINSGWYKERGSNSKTLRISNSNLMMPGTIRFNETPTTFQGFNGNDWVTFNAVQGPPGDPGLNASQLFNFINLPEEYNILDDGPRGEIYESSGTTNVYMRSIQSGIIDINAGLTAMSLNIENDTNYVKLTPQPQPYVWDFTTNNNISYMKSLVSATKFKAFGKISKWIVKSDKTILAGSAVRISLESPGFTQMVIEPFTYTNLSDFNLQSNQTGLGFLGISLENKLGGESCEVCTEGVTTAIMGEYSISPITSKSSVNAGQYAFVNSNATVFTPNNLTSMNTFISLVAGYWLEKTTITFYTSGTVSNDNLGLFYVKSNLNL